MRALGSEYLRSCFLLLSWFFPVFFLISCSFSLPNLTSLKGSLNYKPDLGIAVATSFSLDKTCGFIVYNFSKQLIICVFKFCWYLTFSKSADYLHFQSQLVIYILTNPPKCQQTNQNANKQANSTKQNNWFKSLEAWLWQNKTIDLNP